MKRFACLVALMALSSPAGAREYSFTFHGHHIHVGSHCRSLSCVSVSGAGNVATSNQPAPAQQAPAAAPPPVPLAPARPPVVTAQTEPPAITRAQTIPSVVQAPVQSAPPPAVGFETPKPRLSPPPAPAAQPQIAARPVQPALADAPEAKPQPKPPAAVPAVVRVSRESENAAADTPLGDWQTATKNGGLVRIEACGSSLCGYTLDPTTRSKGETVLVNMKPKNDTEWTGNVYSRTSGNNYYGTMTLKQADTLRVEACALGRFFCSGNNWTRVVAKPDALVSSQRSLSEPRS